MVTVPIPLPIRSSAEVVERLVGAIAAEPRCRLALVDNITGHGTFIRISAHVYNRLADYAQLADALLARGIRGRTP